MVAFQKKVFKNISSWWRRVSGWLKKLRYALYVREWVSQKGTCAHECCVGSKNQRWAVYILHGRPFIIILLTQCFFQFLFQYSLKILEKLKIFWRFQGALIKKHREEKSWTVKINKTRKTNAHNWYNPKIAILDFFSLIYLFFISFMSI